MKFDYPIKYVVIIINKDVIKKKRTISRSLNKMIKDTLKKISPAAPINFLFYQQAKIVKKQKKKKRKDWSRTDKFNKTLRN